MKLHGLMEQLFLQMAESKSPEMKNDEIISLLPYKKPFLFVDSLKEINEKYIEGEYRFRKDEFFYQGHFVIKDKSFPVTPGVILVETMAQIGVVSLGIFLIKEKIFSGEQPEFALTSSEAEFYLPVFPEEKVKVISEKIYFRFGKLKCNVKMKNEKDELVCKAVIAGMLKNISNQTNE
jgi:3-hydroxyacyl-[acyl-carrier-protein] dehydratase